MGYNLLGLSPPPSLPCKPRLQFESKIIAVVLQVDRLMPKLAKVKSKYSLIQLVSGSCVVRIG